MKKILLVEDDELMARMYQRILSFGDDLQVELATDGQQGYEKAKIFKPDLIFLDIMMPIMNGLQALEKLKQDPETKDIIVVMLTNLADKNEAELALKNGAARYMIKSDYDMEDLNKVVAEELGGST